MHIAILGNGFAGVSALDTIRRLDGDVRVTLISAEDCGFYSPASLFAYLEGRVERANLFLRRKEDYAGPGLRAIFGKRAVGLDAAGRSVRLEDGEAIQYDRLLIATGASPRGLELEGSSHRGVFALHTLADAERILAHNGRRAVVVGAGRIGVELAASLREKGVQVTLLESAQSALPGVFDREIADLIRDRLQANGVRTLLGRRLERIYGDPVEGVRTSEEDIPCDTVVLAVGRQPSTGFLAGSQVDLGDAGGVRVDEHLRASQDVYAAGDCAETVDFLGQRAVSAVIPTAIETGRIAALNMLGRPTPYQGSIGGNLVLVFGQAFCSVGSILGEKLLRRVGGRVQLYTLREGRLVGAQFVGGLPEAAQTVSALRRGIRGEMPFDFDLLRRRLFLPVAIANRNRALP